MAQILDPVPNNEKESILCCYVNATSQIQVARITNVSNWYFERVVFPGQRLIFEAIPSALLEIHSGMMASAILSDTIPCHRLTINDNVDDNSSEKKEEPEPRTARQNAYSADVQKHNKVNVNVLEFALV